MLYLAARTPAYTAMPPPSGNVMATRLNDSSIFDASVAAPKSSPGISRRGRRQHPSIQRHHQVDHELDCSVNASRSVARAAQVEARRWWSKSKEGR